MIVLCKHKICVFIINSYIHLLLQNSGFGSESNYEHFQAALKFLHGASLLEVCNAERSKQMETSPMQMYGAAAQLCK